MTNTTNRMVAVTIPEFGTADVLRLDEVKVPEPGPGQIAIEVAYAGVNVAEVLYRQGLVDVPLPFVPGIEVSGHIRALGNGTEGWSVGEPVAALTVVHSGGYAGVVTTSADLVAPLDGLDLGLDVAAAVPSNSTTAFLVLDRVTRIASGESVLVHAAAGGLGSQVGQAARILGAGRVVGTVGRESKIEIARGFGFDEVVLRDRLANSDVPGDSAPSAVSGLFDIVVDMVGGPTRQLSLDRLAPLGRLAVVGNASGADDVGLPAMELWLANKTAAGFNLSLFSALHAAEVGRALRRAMTAVSSGDMRVQVDVLPMTQAADAHRRIESGATTGKLVLDIGSAELV